MSNFSFAGALLFVDGPKRLISSGAVMHLIHQPVCPTTVYSYSLSIRAGAYISSRIGDIFWKNT